MLIASVVMHGPFGLATFHGAREAGLSFWPAVVLALGLVALGIRLFVGRLRGAIDDRPRSWAKLWLLDMPYFVHFGACVFLLVPGLVALLLMPLTGAHLNFFLRTYQTGALIAAYAVFVRRNWFVVKNVDVTIPGLPAAFDGYTIAHLSDLHIGGLMPAASAMRWVRAANERSPDLCVVTGDVVTNGTAFHPDIARVLGALRARDGTVLSMGNHDYFGDGEPLITLVRAAGVTVMRNEGRALERAGESVYLAAIDDTWTRRADMDKALSDRPAGMKTILLAHDPDQWDGARDRDVSLTLSGHTHGGQVAVPFLARWLTLSRFAHAYSLGKFVQGDRTLYVHPGLGTTGPPIRLGVAPAVVILRLRRA